MGPPLWLFSGSGSETEVTVRRNRAVFDRLALMPRVLRNVTSCELDTTFLGHRLSLPVMLAPIGPIVTFHPEGALGPARAADEAGTISFVGGRSDPDLEEVRGSSRGPLVFQLYVYGDRPWVARLVKRVEDAGYDALCVTVDSPDPALGDRYFQSDFETQRRQGSLPNLERMQGETSLPRGMSQTNRHFGAFTWDDLVWLRDTTRLPLILKGVLSPKDAELAVSCGVSAIHVSNHGGRRQDQLPATLEVLPQVISAVGDRAEVIVDGGFLRGTDVVKALAMGARAVLVGRLMIWALAAGGDAGIVRMLEILRREIRATMTNVGCSTVDDLTSELVVPSFQPPVTPWPIEPLGQRETNAQDGWVT
jgi:isopentenyl diphosphate isomerase/L-lactate dehydrogenase-like FMN-dependent dehydrogenase